MRLGDLAGNARLKEILAPRLDSGEFPHAVLLSGPEGSGRKTLARIIASGLVCSSRPRPCGACRDCTRADRGTHPDIVYLEREKDRRQITVETVRAARADCFIAPNQADRKVYIMPEADLMNAHAQNAFLKMLEEPPAHAFFILISENSSALLPTVRSRCMELKLSPVEEEEAYGWLLSRFPSARDELLQAALSGSGGILGRACRIIESGAGDAAQKAAEFMDALLSGRESALLRFCRGFEKRREEFIGFCNSLIFLARDALARRISGKAVDLCIPQMELKTAGISDRIDEAHLVAIIDTASETLRAAQANSNVALAAVAMGIKCWEEIH